MDEDVELAEVEAGQVNDPAGSELPAGQPRKRGGRNFWLDLAIPVLGIAGVILAILGVQRLLMDDADAPRTASDIASGQRSNLGITQTGASGVGESAPEFELQDPQGELVRLTDFRGAPVVVNFWATWCPPCVKEIPDFVMLQEEWGEQVKVVGVNLQEPADSVSMFVERFGINYTIALDREGEVTRAFKLTGLPETFFLDSQGVIRDHRIGLVSADLARCIAAGVLAGEHEPEDCR